jgi:hypothetical protein
MRSWQIILFLSAKTSLPLWTTQRVCDLKFVGAGDQTYKWDIDVTLPVFEKPLSKK